MRYTELDLSSSRLDQVRQDQAPARKLLILSPPRSGSYMLCRYMLHAGLGVPHEYFNDIHMYLIGKRSGLPAFEQAKWMKGDPQHLLLRYLHHIYSIRTRDGLFAAKIQYRHFQLFLRGSVGRELFRNACLVYLTREDIVAQAVSLHLAQLSGRWSFEKTRLTRPQNAGDMRDMAGIARMFTRLAGEETRWEELFTRIGEPMRIGYETICNNPAAVLSRIAARCDVTPESLTLGYDDEGRYPVDAAHPDKDALAAEFRLTYPDLVAGARPPRVPAREPELRQAVSVAL